MIEIVVGDIVTQTTDAIVNSANSSLLPGSGLSGAIHLAAGRHMELECIQIGPCPPGEARITAGYNLPAKYVIHAVAPQYWDGTRGEADTLRNTYRSIYELAKANRIKSISIPAIGTGIYRFPLEAATQIAMEEAFRIFNEIDTRFICFNEEQKQNYQTAFQAERDRKAITAIARADKVIDALCKQLNVPREGLSKVTEEQEDRLAAERRRLRFTSNRKLSDL